MAVKADEAVRIAQGLLGTPYGSGAGELDCINLVKKIIREGAGGVKRYTTAGTNTLWNSQSAAAKYRDVTACRELKGADTGRAGELLVIREGEDCSHVGLAVGDGTVIHASKSLGEVACTQVKGKAWTHALEHRYIEVGEEDGGMGAERPAGTETGEEDAAAGEDVGAAWLGIVCAQGGLRQRQTPGGRYMQMLPDGASVTILKERNGWGLTVWRGHEGWVSLEYVCKEGED